MHVETLQLKNFYSFDPSPPLSLIPFVFHMNFEDKIIVQNNLKSPLIFKTPLTELQRGNPLIIRCCQSCMRPLQDFILLYLKKQIHTYTNSYYRRLVKGAKDLRFLVAKCTLTLTFIMIYLLTCIINLFNNKNKEKVTCAQE